MKTRPTIAGLAVMLGLICLSVPADAASPSERLNCALGYFDVDFDSGLSLSQANVADAQINVRGSDGHALDCSLRILGGWYAHGEASETDGTLSFSSQMDGAADVSGFDADMSFQRLSIGYSVPIGDQFSLYGQLGYSNSDYDFDPIFTIFDALAPEPGSYGSGGDSDGLDVEGGFIWSPIDRLGLSGFAHFAGNSRLAFNESAGIALLRDNKDDLRVGMHLKYRIMDPVFLTTDIAFGSVDTLFLGLGVRY